MREVLRLECPGEPIPQPRQKHRIAGGKTRTAFVQNYIERDHPVQAYKEALRQAAWEAKRYSGLPAEPIDTPMILSVRFYFTRPRYLERRSAPDGLIWHGSRPDWDNCLKAAQDALKGLLWADDARCAGYTDSGKWYVERGGRARTELAIFLP